MAGASGSRSELCKLQAEPRHPASPAVTAPRSHLLLYAPRHPREAQTPVRTPRRAAAGAARTGHSRACVAPEGVQEHLPVVHDHHVPQSDQGGLWGGRRRVQEAVGGGGGGPEGRGAHDSRQSRQSCWSSTPAVRSSRRARSRCQGPGWGGTSRVGGRRGQDTHPGALAPPRPLLGVDPAGPLGKRGKGEMAPDLGGAECGEEANAVDTHGQRPARGGPRPYSSGLALDVPAAGARPGLQAQKGARLGALSRHGKHPQCRLEGGLR